MTQNIGGIMEDRDRDQTGILAKMFEHNMWANVRLLDFCERLSAEQLGSSATGSYGSIAATLAHLVFAEVSYVERVNGRLPAVPPSTREPAEFGVWKEAARWSSEEMLQLALAAKKDTLVTEREGDLAVDYKLASLAVQAITHSTEHRTQVASVITQIGLEPPDMSVWKYLEETGEFREYTVGAGASAENEPPRA